MLSLIALTGREGRMDKNHWMYPWMNCFSLTAPSPQSILTKGTSPSQFSSGSDRVH